MIHHNFQQLSLQNPWEGSEPILQMKKLRLPSSLWSQCETGHMRALLLLIMWSRVSPPDTVKFPFLL